MILLGRDLVNAKLTDKIKTAFKWKIFKPQLQPYMDQFQRKF
jgi:hypothetical protein